jgi:hypothetical protein
LEIAFFNADGGGGGGEVLCIHIPNNYMNN